MVSCDEETGVKKILVVDDNPDNLDIFVHRLKALGSFEILLASNGKQALELAAQSRPDLIFMDLRMPVMNGYAATRALRQTEWGRDLPVVAVTAHTLAEDRDEAFSAGCNDFIPKPVIDYAVIRKAIERLIK